MANKGNRDYARLLSLLSADEQQRLFIFLSSPYCTGKPADNECLRFVKAGLEKSGEEDGAAESIFAKVYPEKAFSDNIFNELARKTKHQIEQFLIAETKGLAEQEQDSLMLLRFFRKRDMLNDFDSTIKKLESSKENKVALSDEAYLINYLIEFEKSQFQSLHNQKKDDLNLQKTIAALDEFYYSQRMLVTCALLIQNHLAPFPSQIDVLLPFDFASANAAFFKKGFGKLLRQAYTLLKGKIEETAYLFDEFYTTLIKESPSLHKEHFDTFERYALHYCARQLNIGNEQFAKQLFQLQKHRVEAGRVYIENSNTILKDEFQSIVAVALRLGEVEWAGQFITAHQKRIGGTRYPSDCYRYNLANYYFHQKDYRAAKRYLLQNTYEDKQYKLSSRILTIKVLYEINDIELDAALDAAKSYLSEKKNKNVAESKPEAKTQKPGKQKIKGQTTDIPKDKWEMCNNFVKAMFRLSRVTPLTEVALVEKILIDVEHTDLIADRAWLIEKLEEILKKIGK